MQVFKTVISEKNKDDVVMLNMTLEGAIKTVETRIGDSVSFSRCESYEVEMYEAEYTEEDILGLGFEMPTLHILIVRTAVGE